MSHGMTDPGAIGEAIRQIAAGLDGVRDSHLGPLAVIPATPAVEVLLGSGSLAQFPGGGHAIDERHDLTVVFLEQVAPNVATTTERRLAALATAFIAALTADGFDDTLGGLVERTRPTGYSFGMTSRNNRAYRYVAVRVDTGEL